MNGVVAYLLGVASVPAGVVLVSGVTYAASPGLLIECRGLLPAGGICLYNTGPRQSTPRIVAELRWRWHRHVIHRHRGA